jgi:hypothetical protein
MAMNASSSTSTVLRSRPGSDPVFGPFGGLFRTTLRDLRLHWFLYRTQRRKVRVPEAMGEMNAHMLRDIGAPDEMVARAAAGKVPLRAERDPVRIHGVARDTGPRRSAGAEFSGERFPDRP